MASGDSLVIWPVSSNEPPAATYATPDKRNARPVLDFALTEIGVFGFMMPQHYGGGGVTFYLIYAMTSAVADDINLSTALERVNDGGLDIDGDSFAAAQNTGDITVPGTSGFTDTVTTAHTDGAQMDSIAVGDGFRVKVLRNAVGGTDATGDLELLWVEMRET